MIVVPLALAYLLWKIQLCKYEESLLKLGKSLNTRGLTYDFCGGISVSAVAHVTLLESSSAHCKQKH